MDAPTPNIGKEVGSAVLGNSLFPLLDEGTPLCSFFGNWLNYFLIGIFKDNNKISYYLSYKYLCICCLIMLMFGVNIFLALLK